MKILLVAPDDRGVLGTNFNGLYVTEPLALTLLAGAVPEHDVSIVDLRLDPVSIEDYIAYQKPNLVGVTGFTAVHDQMEKIMSIAKKAGAFTVTGGPHSSFAWNEFEYADAVVIGEGEGPFRDLVMALDSNRSINEIPNLTWRDQDKWMMNARKFYDLWPLPRRAFAARYKYRVFEYALTNVDATRGCSHRCSFCITPKLHEGRYRVRNQRELADYISKLDEPIIMIEDADFFASNKYVTALAQEIEERGIKKRYMVAARADDIVQQSETVRRWSRLGLIYAFIGIEGFNQQQLNSYRKDIEISSIIEAVSILNECSIISVGTMLVRSDWSLDDFSRCLKYLNRLGTDLPLVSVLTPFPGTGIAIKHARQDFKLYDNLHPLTPTRLPYAEFLRQLLRLQKGSLLGRNLLRLAAKLLHHRLFNPRMFFIPLRLIRYVITMERKLKSEFREENQ